MRKRKCLRRGIVREQFAIPPPANDGLQRAGCVALAQVILELELEPCPRCLVTLPLVEHLANMGDQWDETQEMLTEKAFAFFRPVLSEEASRRRQCDRTVL